jgi:hypothetical protein
VHEGDERAEAGARDAGQDGEVEGDIEVGKAEENEGDLAEKEVKREEETMGPERVDEEVEFAADEVVVEAEEKREEIADPLLEEIGARATHTGAMMVAREERELVADVEGTEEEQEIESEPGLGALVTEVQPCPDRCT